MSNPLNAEKRNPLDYLSSEKFVTEFDAIPRQDDYATLQYEKGLNYATEYDTIFIQCNGCWGAEKPGSVVTSYERIGYHAHTMELLRGFLAGKAEVVIYRYPESGYATETVIKPRS